MAKVAPTTRKGLADRLCEEHTALARRTDLLRAVADEVGAMPLGRLRHDIDSAYDLLAAGIIPHAQHERDLRLHLAVRDCRRVGVRPDELELENLTRELAAVRSRLTDAGGAAAAEELRPILYELHALAKIHFADELPNNAAGSRRH